MANPEHVTILKRGYKAWNKWRRNIDDNSYNIEIDLSGADLRGLDLRNHLLDNINLRNVNLSKAKLFQSYCFQADFRDAILSEADLSDANLFNSTLNRANLSGAYLRGTNLERCKLGNSDLSNAVLSRANLTDSDLTEAQLSGADLTETKLRNATLTNVDLRNANLWGSDLWNAHLKNADFSNANLCQANLSGSHFSHTNFHETRIGGTVFGEVKLSEATNLQNVNHLFPSAISTSSLILSNGKVPEEFLRGCGLSDWEIEAAKLYYPELSNHEIDEILYKTHDLRARQAIQISPLFISYSHDDNSFVDKLEKHLNKNGVRFWRDVYGLKSGRIEKQIDYAISQNPTVVLILSEHSLKSDWVEHEVRTARRLEKEMGRDVLCPIALDESWKKSHWPKRVMEQVMEYNILDFSEWEDNVKFEGMFRKLVGGLQLFYNGEK